MKKKRLFLCLITVFAMLIGLLTACGKEQDSAKTVKLDPSNPVSLTIWHYYNGAQQAAFDKLVSEFNSTTGKEKGIYVEAYSQGSVSDLEKSVTDSANGVVGAKKLPDIFSTYADTAYKIQQKDLLVDLSPYFSKEDLSKYVSSYIEEGYFKDNDSLYLFPVAKSTEVMILNKTDWEPFAKATKTNLKELSTLEGIANVAKRYYEWTDAKTPDVPNDGKAFYGRDSMSNYFIIGMKQMGTDIFDVKDNKLNFNLDKKKIRRLWDNYIPYVNGYFSAMGKFRSDDVKTGDILAYTGSSSSITYFPDQVDAGDKSIPIDYKILPIPILKGGDFVNVQQGAGMVVTKSSEEKEYASSVFLKWFTEPKHNLSFVCDSAYLPVQKEANTKKALDSTIKESDLQISKKNYDCLVSLMKDFKDTTFYTPKSSVNGYSSRSVLDTSLSNRAKQDRAEVEEKLASGVSKKEALAPYISDKSFNSWYKEFCKQLKKAANNTESE